MSRYKCISCKLILDAEFVTDCKCPECGKDVIEMCENDTGSCDHGVVGGIKVCEECGEFMCPICGAHDVSPISRVTGYYSPVDAWCTSKKQELIDRTRYSV